MFELVIGGSGSGKSEYAETRAAQLHDKYGGTLVYAAAMRAYDDEARKKIARHRQNRAGKGFVTLERYTNLKSAEIPKNSVVLLECVSNLLANEMYSEDGAGDNAAQEIVEALSMLKNKCRGFVAVTNDVFSDGKKYSSETEKYIRALAEINRRAALIADRVTEVFYSIPVTIKELKC